LGERVETERAKEPVEKIKGAPEKPKIVETLKTFNKERAKEAAAEEKKQTGKGEVVKKDVKQSRGFLKHMFSRRTGSK